MLSATSLGLRTALDLGLINTTEQTATISLFLLLDSNRLLFIAQKVGGFLFPTNKEFTSSR